MAHTLAATRTGSLVLPALLLAGLLALIGYQAASLFDFPAIGTTAGAAGPQTVVIAPRAYEYRASGEFLRGTAVIDGPVMRMTQPAPLEIMKYQVSASDYALCVADGACEKAAPRRRGTGDVPVTGVSFNDATAYAAWLSRRTGETWRLPTVAEWTFAAGSRAVDTALGVETDAADPAARWLLTYEREAALAAGGATRPEPLGSFGTNEFGVADIAANVWEWTASCGGRTTLDAAGKVVSQMENCGVRYLEGRHRTPMSSFVRDALAGGCATGTPPDNLGFRLVREPNWFEGVLRLL